MRLGWLAAATLLVAAACSGEPPAVITLDTTTTLVPIVRPSTSSTVPTTTAPTTTSIVETTTTLPDGITLTFAQPGTPEAEVEIALHLGVAAFLKAIREPVDPNYSELLSTHGEPLLSFVQGNIQVLVDEGWATRPGIGELASDYITGISISEDGRSATVTDCVLDDGVVYDIATGEVLNDEVSTSTKLISLTRIDGDWRITDTELLEQVEGIGGCLELDT